MNIVLVKGGDGQNTYEFKGKREEAITRQKVEAWLKENKIPYNKVYSQPRSNNYARVFVKAPSGILDSTPQFQSWVKGQEAIEKRKQQEQTMTSPVDTKAGTSTGITETDYSKASTVEIKKEYTPQEAYGLGVISYREAQQSKEQGLIYTIPESDVKKAIDLREKWGSKAKVSPGQSAFDTFAYYESQLGGRTAQEIRIEKAMTQGLTEDERKSLQKSIFDPGEGLGFLEERVQQANAMKDVYVGSEKVASGSRDPIAKVGQWAVESTTSLGRVVEAWTKPAQWKVAGNYLSMPTEDRGSLTKQEVGGMVKYATEKPGDFIGRMATGIAISYGVSKGVSGLIGKIRGVTAKQTTTVDSSKVNQVVSGDKSISLGKGSAVSKVGKGRKAVTVKSEVYSKGVAQKLSGKVVQGKTGYAVKTTPIDKLGNPVGKTVKTVAVTDDVLYAKSTYESIGGSIGKYLSESKKALGTKLTGGRLGSLFKQTKLWEVQKGALTKGEYIAFGKSATTVGNKLSTAGAFGSKSVVRTIDITGMGSGGSGSGVVFQSLGKGSGSVLSNIAKSTAENVAKNLYKTKVTPTLPTNVGTGIGLSRVATARSSLDVVKHSPARAELSTKEIKQADKDLRMTPIADNQGKLAQEFRLNIDSKQRTMTLQSLAMDSVQDRKQNIKQRIVPNQIEDIVSTNRMLQIPSQLTMSFQDTQQSQRQKSASALRFRTVRPVSSPPLSIPVIPNPGGGGFGLPGFGMDVRGLRGKRKPKGKPWWYYEIDNPVATPKELLGVKI